MGIREWLGFGKTITLPEPGELQAPIISAYMNDLLMQVRNQSPADLWRSQPYLRMVVSFRARNVAQIGLHALEHQPDGGRERVRTGPIGELLREPNPDQTWYELMFGLVSTFDLYDEVLLYIADDGERLFIRHIPRDWLLQWIDADAYDIRGARVRFPGDDDNGRIIPEQNLIRIHGWSPEDERFGASPIEALRVILEEQIQAQIFRLQMWKRGGRVGSYVTRPKDAPEWTPEARERFKRNFQAAFTGEGGSQAGGVPVFEDGMEWNKLSVTAREEEYVEASKLALTTVAGVYHVNPTMLGLLDNANYSNVKEFRKSLYGDTLGPLLKQISEKLNSRVVRYVKDRPYLADQHGNIDNIYLEFNLREKLQGSFEEESNVLGSAVGGPWLTVNEARARQNLPSVEDGDRLFQPLNLGLSGQEQVEAEDQGQPAAISQLPAGEEQE
ncbi:phage portal protein [Corynebacterium macclintockiae]|uniref:phage portal protein n=1 Tax=Corynebacterium macclintockiae TaxID=2913501 RepID=UPI003EBE5DC9